MIGVLVNPRAGYVAKHGSDQVQSMIVAAVPDARIVILQPQDDIRARCGELLSAGATRIAAMGGDGTISSVAAVLIDTQIPLGVIPGGTFNNFARDVGVGRNVPDAIRTVAGSQVVPVDVATVNDHVFLNNSSIGLYPEMVHLREAEQKRLGKTRARVRGLALAFRRTRWTDVRISNGDQVDRVRTRLLFVGNNRYELGLLRLGRRARLDEGVLSCFVLDAPTRFHLFETAVRSQWSKPTDHKYFRSLSASEMTVMPDQEGDVDVSADGEVFSMRTPLVYRIHPGALQVVVPPRAADRRSNES